MNITFRHIEIFIQVAQHLSITKAANALFLTQPAISMQIKQLEQQVGIALLNHRGKRLSLTQAGDAFLSSCLRIKNELHDAKQILQEFKAVQRGILKISVASTLSHFAVHSIQQFLQQQPNIQIHFEVTNRQRVLKNLKNLSTDIVMMGTPPSDQDLAFSVIKANPLIVIAPKQHQLSQQSHISLHQLCQHTFVMREQGSGTRLAFETLLNSQAQALKNYMTINNNESILMCVEAGLGLGVVSFHTCEEKLKQGNLIQLPVEHFPILKKWYIVNRKSYHLPAVAKLFRDFVRQQSS